jgi:hypothetical protein
MTGSGLSWQHGGMRPTAYRRNARGLRDRQAFEGVRMQAGELFAAGHTQAEVARTLLTSHHHRAGRERRAVFRADGTKIWSLMQLERQLHPEVFGRRRGGYIDCRRSPAAGPTTHGRTYSSK